MIVDMRRERRLHRPLFIQELEVERLSVRRANRRPHQKVKVFFFKSFFRQKKDLTWEQFDSMRGM